MRPQNLRFLTFTIFTVLVLQVDSTQPPFSCDSSNPSTKTFPFCKTTLPISQRATDLVARLTLEEKISQLVNSAQPIPRLGVPGYQWWSEPPRHYTALPMQDLAFVSMVLLRGPLVSLKSFFPLLLLMPTNGIALVRYNHPNTTLIFLNFCLQEY